MDRIPASLTALPDGSPALTLRLEHGKPCVIGRSEEADLRVPSDRGVSRRHAEVLVEGARLRVRRLDGATNPVFFQGKARDEFEAGDGEQFVVGLTRFVFRAGQALGEDLPRFSRTLRESDLYQLGPGSDRVRLLDLLELPELLRAKSEPEFLRHVAAMLRLATGARWARVAVPDGSPVAEDAVEDAGRPRSCSRTLLQAALEQSPRPTLFRWSQPDGPRPATPIAPTSAGTAGLRPARAAGSPDPGPGGDGMDWAIGAAARVSGEPALVFYVAGVDGDAPPELQAEDARLIGLVADIVGRTLSVRRLESRERSLERFFSRPVIEKILDSARDPEALKPRLALGTVLFFELRGFHEQAEGRNERILELLGELRPAMNAMTEEVLRENGVVLQYESHGMLACWNVPIPDAAHVERAARAASAMAKRLAEVRPGWSCAVGLHSGEVVAGEIDSDQFFAYGVLGAVVDQARRIGGIARLVEAPILASREVAERLRPQTASAVRLGRFRPAGMEAAMDLFELTPPPGDAARALRLSRGLEALEAGWWQAACEAFGELPAEDLPARFLGSLAERHRRSPPKDWSCVIELDGG